MNLLVRRYCQYAAKCSETHKFNQTSFTNLQELSMHLKENLVYKHKGLVLMNKPAGLRKELPKTREKGKIIDISMSPSMANIDYLTFSDVIPYLSRELKMPQLELIKVPERFTSGLSILCDNEYMKKRIKKAFGDLSAPLFTYLAVCIGSPVKPSLNIKVGSTLVTKGGKTKVVFLKSYSKRKVAKSEVMPVVMNHDILSTNENLNVSLVRISNNRNKWHGLRAYCAQKLLSPILGDLLFGSCVRMMINKAMPINPFNPVADFPPRLPENILSALELKRSQNNIVPLHLHLGRFEWKKYNGGTAFIAKPPDHFLWTCEKLNLTIPESYLKNGSEPLDVHVVESNKEEKIM